MREFSLLVKPSGSDCNLDCTYCFYKCRPSEIGTGRQRMSDDVLERMTKDYLSLRLNVSSFAWQGGEPTLMGLNFYKKAVELQKRYAAEGQIVSNALQTNGVVLNEKWCRFLAAHQFLVGISIDGPKQYHDHYRLDLAGKPTFDRVMRGIENCKQFHVEYNTLTLLNDVNVRHPDALMDFFVENDIFYLQFIPCLELDPKTREVAGFSITPEQYGHFLCRIFDRWYELGSDRPSIRDFDSILSWCVQGHHTICTFERQCSGYVVIEHTGDAYCCDFFVKPQWHLGNIMDTPIAELANSPKKRAFARLKKNLCHQCLLCRHLQVCRGGCMKDRAPFDEKNYGTQSYFCEAYRQFFDYTMPRFMQLAADIKAEHESS